jgi:hypothetical protein
MNTPQPPAAGDGPSHHPGDRIILALDYPEPWFEFPLAPDADLPTWAQAEAARIVASADDPDVPEETRLLTPDVAQLAEELLTRAQEYRDQQLVFALGCYPPGVDTSDVGMEVGYVYPEDGDPPLTLDWFAERNITRELGEPLLWRGELPAGGAVRIRQNYPGARKSWFGGRTINRSLIYGVHPPGCGALVALTTLWTDPGIDEYIEAWADEIAEALRTERPR